MIYIQYARHKSNPEVPSLQLRYVNRSISALRGRRLRASVWHLEHAYRCAWSSIGMTGWLRKSLGETYDVMERAYPEVVFSL